MNVDFITDERVQFAIKESLKGRKVADIARQMNISQNYLSQLVKAKSGLTITGWKLRKEMEINSLFKNSFDEKDPRSFVCQQIKICGHHTCYLHAVCPAFTEFSKRYGRRHDSC